MDSIIGLLNSEAEVIPAVERLKEAGVAEEKITIISNPKTISTMLGCDPACVIKNYAVWGAAISTGIYAIFGLGAAMCQCNLMKFGLEYGVGTFIGAILAGTIIGGIIGILIGAGEAEKDTHLYVQGVRLGGKVISIRVPQEDAERVKHILAFEHILGVKELRLEGD